MLLASLVGFFRRDKYHVGDVVLQVTAFCVEDRRVQLSKAGGSL